MLDSPTPRRLDSKQIRLAWQEPVVFAAGLDLSLHALGYSSFGAESQLYVRANLTLPAYAECLYQLRDGTLLVGLVSGLLMRVRLVGEGVKSELVVGRSTQVGRASIAVT
jgi:hypothetical protein